MTRSRPRSPDESPPTTSRRGRQLAGAAALLVGVVGFQLCAFASNLYPRLPILAVRRPDMWLGDAEVTLYVLFAVFALPLLGVMAYELRFPARDPIAVARRPVPTRELWVWGAIALALATLFGTLREWQQVTDDAEVYRLQARLLLAGQVSEPMPVPIASVANPFVVPLDEQRWAGCYPLLAAMWTAPGEAVGFPNLLWLLSAPLLVVVGVRATEAVFRVMPDVAPAAPRPAPDSERVNRLPAFLFATSPLLAGLASTMHTALLAALLLAASVGLLANLARRLAVNRLSGKRFDLRLLATGVLLGSTMGALAHARPVDLIAVGGVVGLGLVVLGARFGLGQVAVPIAGVLLGGIPMMLALLAYNYAVTGDPLTMPYQLLFGGIPVYGFGKTAGGLLTWGIASKVASVQLVRLSQWSHAHPFGLLIAVTGAVLVATFRGPHTRVTVGLLLLLVMLHVVMYLPAPFGEVPTAGMTYSAARFVALTMLLAIGAVAWPRLTTPLLWLSAFGWLTFVPAELSRQPAAARWTLQPEAVAAELVAHNGPIAIAHPSFAIQPTRSMVLAPPIPTRPDPEVLWIFVPEGTQPNSAGRGLTRSEALQVAGERPLFMLHLVGGNAPHVTATRVDRSEAEPGP